VLTEPASAQAKAWEQIERIRSRACAVHDLALISGAGPIRLLATLMSIQRGIETHVLDRAEQGIKPMLVEALGAHHHTGPIEQLCEQAGARHHRRVHRRGPTGGHAMRFTGPGAIACRTGVAPSRSLAVDVGEINNGSCSRAPWSLPRSTTVATSSKLLIVASRFRFPDECERVVTEPHTLAADEQEQHGEHVRVRAPPWRLR
jgi:Glucose dehydrogenase C-terminus